MRVGVGNQPEPSRERVSARIVPGTHRENQLTMTIQGLHQNHKNISPPLRRSLSTSTLINNRNNGALPLRLRLGRRRNPQPRHADAHLRPRKRRNGTRPCPDAQPEMLQRGDAPPCLCRLFCPRGNQTVRARGEQSAQCDEYRTGSRCEGGDPGELESDRAVGQIFDGDGDGAVEGRFGAGGARLWWEQSAWECCVCEACGGWQVLIFS